MKLRIYFSKKHNDYLSDKTVMNCVSSQSEKETCFPSVDIRSKSIAHRTHLKADFEFSKENITANTIIASG